MPERTISECLAIIQDHPDYAPPYYRVGYDYLWPIGNRAKSKKYLSIYVKLADSDPDKILEANHLLQSMK